MRQITLISVNILFFFLLSAALQAQKKESDSSIVQKATVKVFGLDESTFLDEDTFELDHSPFFSPNDFFSARRNSNGLLGGFGQTMDSEELFGNLYMDYFNLFTDRFENLPSLSGIQRFRNDTGFTLAKYSMGSKREQSFRILHSQKLSKSFRTCIDYNIINAPSAYKNMKTEANGFSGYLEFAPDSSRYQAIAGLILGKMYDKQNGGIDSLQYFIDTLKYDRFITPVNLYSAQSRQKQKNMFIRQEYMLSKKHTGWSIAHMLNYKHLHAVYYDKIDTATTYYPHIYKDSLETRDSIAHDAVENRLSLCKMHGEHLRGYITFYRSDDRLYRLDTLEKLSQNYFLWDWRYAFGKNELGFYGYKDIPDFGQSDFTFDFSFSTSVDSLLDISARAFWYKLTPSIIFDRYSGNHYSWEIEPGQYQNQGADIHFAAYKNDLSFHVMMPQKFLFFDDTMGIQVSGKSTVFKIQLEGETLFGKFKEKHFAAWQKVSGENHVKIPEFMGNLQFCYENNLFKKAMQFELGISVNYNTAYYANGWNPVLQTFFEQNTVKTGNFIYPSAFLNARIKRAIIYVELQNFTQGLLKTRYMQIPYYPLQDRGIRFGILWTFFN